MAARRSRKQQAGLGCVGYLAAGVISIVVLAYLFQESVLHPALGIGVVLAVGTGGGLAVKRRHDQRVQGQIEAQRQWEIREARSREIAPYHQMGPKEFEEALAFLCERDGCTDVRVVGGAGDMGADVMAVAPDGRLIVLQAKRYGPTTKVGSPDLHKFGGTCYNVHQAQVAAVVTTSSFTKQATAYAAQMSIGLFDAEGLAGWASRTGPAPWQ